MTILTSIILVAAIIAVALAIAYNVQKGTKTLEELRANFYENEEIQEAVEVVKKAIEQSSTEEVVKSQTETQV